MAEFITVPINTDPQDLLNDVYTFIQSVIPGWTPALGNLDVWLAMAFSVIAAENRDVASSVPPAIFRYFGNSVLNLPPVDATQAHTTTHWTVQDNAGYTIPDGTQVSIPGPDATSVVFTTTGDTIIPPGSTTASGVVITAVEYGEVGSDLGGVGTTVNLEDPLAFVTAITQDALTTGGQDAESDDDYLNRLSSELQLLTPRPILPNDFAVLLRNIAGVYRATAIDGYSPYHNLLSLNDASVETSIAGWANLANANLAQSATQAADGIQSLRLSSVAAGDMSAELIAADAPAVSPGDTITAVASFRAGATGRTVKVGLAWVDAGGALIGAVVYGATTADVTTGFVQAAVTAVAPATAAKVRPVVYVVGAGGVAELHYVDMMSIRRGTGVDWVPGGSPEYGNPRTVSVAAMDQSGNALDSATKIAGAAYLQLMREVNFLVYVIDPAYNTIDVTYEIHVLTGYDPTATLAAVTAAINAYLKSSTWGATSTDPLIWNNNAVIRLNKMIQVIEDVAGVDYAPTTQVKMAIHPNAVAAADVTLVGVAPLPVPGTIAGTVV